LLTLKLASVYYKKMPAELNIFVNDIPVPLEPPPHPPGITALPNQEPLFNAVSGPASRGEKVTVRVETHIWGQGVASNLAHDIRLLLGPDIPIQVDGKGTTATIEVG
jgi:hypothetical protein